MSVICFVNLFRFSQHKLLISIVQQLAYLKRCSLKLRKLLFLLNTGDLTEASAILLSATFSFFVTNIPVFMFRMINTQTLQKASGIKFNYFQTDGQLVIMYFFSIRDAKKKMVGEIDCSNLQYCPTELCEQLSKFPEIHAKKKQANSSVVGLLETL